MTTDAAAEGETAGTRRGSGLSSRSTGQFGGWRGTEENTSDGVAVTVGTVAAAADEFDRVIGAVSPPTARSALRLTYGHDDLEPIGVLERVSNLARAVGRVSSPAGVGTGFMLSSSVFVTCNHVLVGSGYRPAAMVDLERLDVAFNYEQDARGKLRLPALYRAKQETPLFADSTLDVAVFELDGAPGDAWGFLPVATSTPHLGEDVFVIQHPGGGPKQIVLAGNECVYVDETVVQYTADTLPGSSGAPVFSRSWQLCALHRRGGDPVIPKSGTPYYRNEGVLLSAVIERIPNDLQTQVAASEQEAR
jgi:V8-like Glu-specific endopeptidase